MPSLPIGTIGWTDLTVPDAAAVRDFYQAVVGWSASEIAMNGYADYCMLPAPDAAPVAGICHARGPNAALPAQWLVYITVADLDASLAAVTAGGGAVIAGPSSAGPEQRMAVIRDPAGAACALYEDRRTA